MSKYPDRETVISILVEAATKRAYESGVTHPEDVAHQMSLAIECVGSVIQRSFLEFSKKK